MANSPNFADISAIINELNAQATGSGPLAVTDTSSLVNVASLTFTKGMDPVLNALTQMFSRVIFAIRPYTRRFKGLEKTREEFGAITRKINYGDQEAETDPTYSVKAGDGSAYNPWVVSPPDPVEYFFQGISTWVRQQTFFKDQLKVSFENPAQLQEFLTGQLQNISDQIEQDHENTARGTLVNLMAGVLSVNNRPQVVHLLTEYNAATGSEFTAETIMQPSNYIGFVPWMTARIAAVSRMLTERSNIYHFNVDGSPTLNRHTPYADQRIYILANDLYQMNHRVISDIYHDQDLRLAVTEAVGFWQSIESPDTINTTPSLLSTTSGAVTKGAAVNQSAVLGVIMDRDAAGYATFNDWIGNGIMNPRAGYRTDFWHYADKFFNDFTENAVVFVLD